MDKFMQPTHLYLHSNALDYGGKLGDSHQQTTVVYEAFRAPMFIPAHIREVYEQGKFDYAPANTDYNATELWQ